MKSTTLEFQMAALIMRTSKMRKRKQTNLSSSCRINEKIISKILDEEQQIPPTKKSKRSQDIDELEGITSGIEVGGSYYRNQDEPRRICLTGKLRVLPKIVFGWTN